MSMQTPLADNSPITPEQRRKLCHALGIDCACVEPTRNFYAEDPDDPDMNALVGLGYMQQGKTIPGRLVYFHVTEAGRNLLAVDIVKAECAYWILRCIELEAIIKEEGLA